MFQRLVLLFCLVVSVSGLGGCATTSLFTPYPERAAAYRQAAATGSFQPALDDLNQRRDDADRILFLMERGRLAQLAGDTDASQRDFADAITAIGQADQRAIVSARHTLALGAAMISNDNSIPYEGAAYERVFLHHFQSLNYLAKGDLEGALVEVRRANGLQEQAARDHQALIDSAREEAGNRGAAADTSHFQRYFAPLDDAANHVRNAFQNAYTFYVSGLLYEAAGKLDDAYIDYKRALAIHPENPYLQQDVLRLAQTLGRKDDITSISGRVALLPPPPAGSGSVVFLYEEGFAPVKQAVTVPIPWPEAWYVVSFPTYTEAWAPAPALEISNGAQRLGTAPVVDVQALASRALRDDLYPMIVRQTLRAVAKHELQQRMDQQGGLIGMATWVYNLVSEQADLRSWQTLPHSAQIARMWLPAGPQTLSLAGPYTQTTMTVPVQSGRITVVQIIAAGGKVYSKSYLL